MNENDPGYTILKNKRDVTRFQILVDIAAHQPAIRQQEIAAGLGVTPQAISEYVRELTEEGMLKAPGMKSQGKVLSGSCTMQKFLKHMHGISEMMSLNRFRSGQPLQRRI